MFFARRDLFESKTTGASSDVTSETYWIGDARAISLQLIGSAFTIQASNDEGRLAAIANWSNVTNLGAQAVTSAPIVIEPGLSWLRVLGSAVTQCVLAVHNAGSDGG
jgi:hypothetical protein